MAVYRSLPAYDRLKLLLVNGKSGTIVSAMATGSAGQLNQEGSTIFARVMRPSARLVLCETWGGNPLLNAARRLRARVAGEAEEQGEDIILSRKELHALDPWFDSLVVEPMNLLAMGKRLLRGRFGNPTARGLVHVLEGTDRALLGLLPALRGWCGEAVITARRRSET